MAVPRSESSIKVNLLRQLSSQQALDAILLQRVSSLAWATAGAAAYVNTATSLAEASILVTPEGQYLITNNIEAKRLEKEEKLTSQGWDFQVFPWYEKNSPLARLLRGRKLGADWHYPGAVDLSGELARLRANLTPEEGDRFRTLGQLCAQAMQASAGTIHPGQSEHEIAALLAGEAERRGAQAIVNLIAVDERIFDFRHPLPSDRMLEHYAMLVLCGRRWGLVCSLTRLVYFGRLPDEIRRKADAVAQVDAAMIAATRPGNTLGQVFKKAQEAYATVGYADEWQLHHQGGPAGYEARETIATPDSRDTVRAGQVYAWNPSITGCKSEDSVLVSEGGFEVLSTIPGWPAINVEAGGQTIERPDIWVVN